MWLCSLHTHQALHQGHGVLAILGHYTRWSDLRISRKGFCNPIATPYSSSVCKAEAVVVSNVVIVRVNVSTLEPKLGIVNIRVAELTPGNPNILSSALLFDWSDVFVLNCGSLSWFVLEVWETVRLVFGSRSPVARSDVTSESEDVNNCDMFLAVLDGSGQVKFEACVPAVAMGDPPGLRAEPPSSVFVSFPEKTPPFSFHVSGIQIMSPICIEFRLPLSSV